MISKTRRTRKTRRNRISKSRKIYGGKKGDEFKWDLGEGVIIYRKEGLIFDDYWIEYTPPPQSTQQWGVGIMLAERKGCLTVVGLVPGGPADKSQAIQEGDRLVKIDGKSVVGEGIFEQVRPLVLGDRGSSIIIGLARTPDSQTESITLTLTRDNPPNDLPLKEDLENFQNFQKLKTQYKGWTLDINDQHVPMITSQTYGIDKFVEKVFFIQGTAYIIDPDSGIGECDVPFANPFSKSVLDKIKQNNEVHEKFIQLRDAIRKFSDEHYDLKTLKEIASPSTVHVGSRCSSRSSNNAGFSPFGLIGLL